MNNSRLIFTFPLDTPIAYRNKTENISMKPDIPVPEPNVMTRSEGSAFR